MNVLVLEDGGGVLVAAVMCAAAALATSGVEMNDIPSACSVVREEWGEGGTEGGREGGTGEGREGGTHLHAIMYVTDMENSVHDCIN